MSLTDATREVDERGKPYVLFHFEVVLPEHARRTSALPPPLREEQQRNVSHPNGVGSFLRRTVIARRFKDFVALDASLRAVSESIAASPIGPLPPLPSAFTLNKTSRSVIARRKVSLLKYLKHIVTVPALERQQEVGAACLRLPPAARPSSPTSSLTPVPIPPAHPQVRDFLQLRTIFPSASTPTFFASPTRAMTSPNLNVQRRSGASPRLLTFELPLKSPTVAGKVRTSGHSQHELLSVEEDGEDGDAE